MSFSIHFVQAYWPGVIGLVAGGVVGALLAAFRRDSPGGWDARVTLPLLLAACGAHLALVSAVEQQRQILFALYAAALLGVAMFAKVGISIWRLGAVVFPLGSIGAYVYFALSVHQADYIGMLVKLVEVGAVLAALTPVMSRERRTRAGPTPT